MSIILFHLADFTKLHLYTKNGIRNEKNEYIDKIVNEIWSDTLRVFIDKLTRPVSKLLVKNMKRPMNFESDILMKLRQSSNCWFNKIGIMDELISLILLFS